MDDGNSVELLHGFRRKWRRVHETTDRHEDAANQSHAIDDDVLVAESATVLDSGLPVDVDPPSPVSPGLGFNPEVFPFEWQSEYEPSIAQSVDVTAPGVDVGGVSTKQDDNAAISDTFIRAAKFTGIVMPWETPLMSQVFGNIHPHANLSMPLDWGNMGMPVSESAAAGPSQPAVPSDKRWKALGYVRHKTDETYMQQRAKTLDNALSKWRFIVLLDVTTSEVGRQLVGLAEDQVDLVLNSVMGVKSPNTIMKRANAMMLFYRWHAINGTAPMLPFDESDIWNYVLSNADAATSASRSQSLVQALRFAHYVMGFDNALACANSRRVMGQAQIQVSLREPMKQARPLTVDEVKTLHNIADSSAYSRVDRCIASNLLLAVYGRCRVSDVNHIHEILHDVSGSAGFLEVTTRCHKSARTVQQKSILLPILMSCSGVVQFPWVHSWIANRKACGLPVSGLVSGALMPAPIVGDHIAWMKRPLSAGEVTNILKGFLDTTDPSLSSHSLKATTLSWAAKAEVPREQRRILGRHSSSVQGSDSFYSRDLSVGPVNSLQKVICMIRDGTFAPDATRANFFPQTAAGAAGTPAHLIMQPFTPAFLERAQPVTPGMGPVNLGRDGTTPEASGAISRSGGDDVKSEASWSVLLPNEAGCEVIELTSSSEGESSESNTCSSTSGEDEPIDLDEPDPVAAAPGNDAAALSEPMMIKNSKTKIIHEANADPQDIAESKESTMHFLKGKLTKCGHVITGNYQVVSTSVDWTAKCRVCYKGRRAPA